MTAIAPARVLYHGAMIPAALLRDPLRELPLYLLRGFSGPRLVRAARVTDITTTAHALFATTQTGVMVVLDRELWPGMTRNAWLVWDTDTVDVLRPAVLRDSDAALANKDLVIAHERDATHLAHNLQALGVWAQHAPATATADPAAGLALHADPLTPEQTELLQRPVDSALQRTVPLFIHNDYTAGVVRGAAVVRVVLDERRKTLLVQCSSGMHYLPVRFGYKLNDLHPGWWLVWSPSLWTGDGVEKPMILSADAAQARLRRFPAAPESTDALSALEMRAVADALNHPALLTWDLHQHRVAGDLELRAVRIAHVQRRDYDDAQVWVRVADPTNTTVALRVHPAAIDQVAVGDWVTVWSHQPIGAFGEILHRWCPHAELARFITPNV